MVFKIARRLVGAVLLSASLSCLPVQANIWDVTFNRQYVRYCEEIGERFYLSPEMLEAIIEHESGGDPTVGNSLGCYGLMGVSARWNADRMKRLGVYDLHDPYSNILTASDLLLELFEKYEDPYEVLRFYGGYPEGDYKFSEQIMTRARELEIVHGKHDYLFDIKG